MSFKVAGRLKSFQTACFKMGQRFALLKRDCMLSAVFCAGYGANISFDICGLCFSEVLKAIWAKRASSLSDGLNEKSDVGWDEIPTIIEITEMLGWQPNLSKLDFALEKLSKLIWAKRASSLSDGLNEKSAVGWDEIQQ